MLLLLNVRYQTHVQQFIKDWMMQEQISSVDDLQ